MTYEVIRREQIMGKEMQSETVEDLRIEVVRADQGLAVIHISMPADEFDDLATAIKVKCKMDALC